MLAALGKVSEAYGVMADYPVGEHQVRDNPVVWFKAFVSLCAGRTAEAQRLAAMFAPRDFDASHPLDETELVRLWSLARNASNTPIEATFPGLAEFRRRNASPRQAKVEALAQTAERPTVLIVARVDSRHGGLSFQPRPVRSPGGTGAASCVSCRMPTAVIAPTLSECRL